MTVRYLTAKPRNQTPGQGINKRNAGSDGVKARRA
jgi:hypothetical protein